MEEEKDRLDHSDTALAATNVETRDAPAGEHDPLLGTSLAGRYRVESRIGRGGMGLVYEAKHEALGKRVAIKVIRRELAGDEASLARFEREAKAAAALSGEHIVDVVDYGVTEAGEAFMVMELLEGQTLEQLLLREGGLEPGRAVAIIRQVAKGLAAAHEGGVIHRDLKTANVFLVEREGRDHVKLLDFGISKLASASEEEVRLTSTGAVMGTPNYMSPEQARGQSDLDHRVDIYALGVILFEMLTGQVPYTGTNFLEIAYRILNKPAPTASAARPDAAIPAELDAVVARCLEKEPHARFGTAHEVIEALPEPSALPGGWSSGGQPAARASAPASVSPAEPGPARPSAGAIAALLLALAAGGVGAWLLLGSGAGDPSELEADPPARADGPRPASSSARVLPAAAATDAAPALPSRDGAEPALPAAPDAGSAEPAAPPGATVRLEIVPSPPQAEVWLDGNRLGTGTQAAELPRGAEPVEVLVKARGFETRRRQVLPDRSRSIDVPLARSGGGTSDGQQGEPPRAPAPGDLMESPYSN